MANKLKTAALILCVLNAASIAESADPIKLRYCPEIGAKRTLCVTYRLTSQYDTMGHQDRTEYMKAWTVELEPVARHADGSTTIRVGIHRIQDEATMHTPGQTHNMMQFDSADNKHLKNESMAASAAFLHATFTARLSPQGHVVDTLEESCPVHAPPPENLHGLVAAVNAQPVAAPAGGTCTGVLSMSSKGTPIPKLATLNSRTTS